MNMYLDDVKKKQKSNFNQVKDWMKDVGQDVPEKFKMMDKDILELRMILISEEFKEVKEALHSIIAFMNVSDEGRAGVNLEDLYINLLKELADLLVVTYGTFVTTGIDGNDAHTIVMDNNFGKVTCRVVRGDGKIIVPDDVKKKLKEEVNAKLRGLIHAIK